jgi:PAS domain S-box-containing protein
MKLMGWQYTPYASLLLGAATASAVLAAYSWRRREAAGARAVALLMLAVMLWTLGYALEISAAGLHTKVFWAKVEYLGIVTVPVAWLAFALGYTGRKNWLTRPNLALLAAIPAITLLLVATNEAHRLVWSRTALDRSGTFLLIEHGAWFWVYLSYSYLVLLGGTVALISALIRSPRLYRRQGTAVLAGVAVPWVGNGMYVLGLNPLPRLDLTPFTFVISGAALSWGLFRFRLLDIAPVARDAVIEGMDDGVLAVDSRGRVVDLNPAAQRILGHPASEAVGETLARVAPAIDTLLGGLPEEAHAEVELGEEGERRIYDLTLSPLRNRRGRRTGWLLMLHDVTERKRAERELARTNAELEHFAYLIAHDLRAPLRGISGFSHILLEDHADRLDEEGRAYLRRVQAAALRLGQLIDELLELSRLTRAEMHHHTVDLSALVRVIAAQLEHDQPNRRARFVIADGITASGDTRLLKVALWNLLDNAWKFTAREEEARIEVGVDRSGPEPVYYVRDNGVGFDEAYADKLFGTFQRLHPSGEFEGTGMGLATVWRIVERHGGRVWAEGEVGRGATFYFTLPDEGPNAGPPDTMSGGRIT